MTPEVTLKEVHAATGELVRLIEIRDWPPYYRIVVGSGTSLISYICREEDDADKSFSQELQMRGGRSDKKYSNCHCIHCSRDHSNWE